MDAERRDRRGTPPGKGTVLPAAGGRIGNPPFVPTQADRDRVKLYARVMSIDMIASSFDPPVSRETVQRHFRRELDDGKREAVAAVGAKLLAKALAGDKACMIFFLKTQGKWNSRIEITGPGGGPLQHVDLTPFLLGKSEAELAIIEPFLEQLLAAGGDDLDLGDQGGFGAGPGGETTSGA